MDDIYEFTVPIFVKTLGGLKRVLEKASAHLTENGITEEEFLNDRLAPDMFPLVRQVQVATDNAKGGAARLAGIEAPKYEDTEKTIAELNNRIDRTIVFLQGIDQEMFAESERRQIVLPYFKDKYMVGFDYAREYLIPNFFFHVAIAYALVRKNGVAIGKRDYINGMPLQDF